jgi:hypothetical protein
VVAVQVAELLMVAIAVAGTVNTGGGGGGGGGEGGGTGQSGGAGGSGIVIVSYTLAKATGGTVTKTATHWVHTFTSSGTFTPTQSLNC